MDFSRPRRIRFSDCDPAGIVFYPQYFVLFNDMFEEWVDELFADGFAGYILHRRCGLPTVHLEADFKSISRMGDDVVLSMKARRVGRSSFELAWSCTGSDGLLRMSFRQTLVTTSLETHLAIPIPPELRDGLARVLDADTQPARGLAS